MDTTLPATFARLRNHIITGFNSLMPVLITVAVIMKFWGQLPYPTASPLRRP